MSESIDLEFLAQQCERILSEVVAIRTNAATMCAELAGMRIDSAGVRTEMTGVRGELASLRDAISTMGRAWSR